MSSVPSDVRKISVRSLARPGRPGLRAGVVATAAAVIVVMAILVSNSVAEHVTNAAVDEAIGAARTLIHSDMDNLLSAESIKAPTAAEAQQINDHLARLTAVGHLVRIKVWSPTSTIVFSDDPGIRGRSFPLADDLEEALTGTDAWEIAPPSAAENVDEVGLASSLLQIYLPIKDPGSNAIIGSYEVYQNAAPILIHVDKTRTDVLLVVGGASAALLMILYGAFSLTSRRLSRQNRQLVEQASQQQVLAADLRRSEERFRSLVQNSADIILVATPAGVIRYESPAVNRVLGHDPATRIGRSVDELVHPDDLGVARQLRANVAGTANGQARAQLRLRHANGGWRVLEVAAADYTDDPAVSGIVLNYHDVTDRVRLEEQLTHQAFHDALTGLANRALFRDRVTHALSRIRRRKPIAVLFLDLDDFKTINDFRGHTRGDQLLTAVAKRLELALRQGDTAARLGGDEFAILVEDATTPQIAVRVAERILAALREPFHVGGAPVMVRVSIGISFSEPGQSTDQVLSNADLAMYLAKGAGGHRYAIYDATMHEQAAERITLRSDLGLAIERDEFFLVYQPIFDLTTKAVTGVEALVRWRHPSRGVLMPAAFIPASEETGLIIPIGAWVLRRACAEARTLDAIGDNVSVAVNVSARQLNSEGFVETVRRTLADTGLEPSRLVLEVTESALIEDIDEAIVTLQALRALGIRLAIDDFGTGYASLTYLHRFPVDILKIDQSFVSSVNDGPTHSSLVGSIVRMGRMLGLTTIAEGIEEDGQRDELTRLGADEGQGYLLGYPVELVSLIASLTATPVDAVVPRPRRRSRAAHVTPS